jgi:hypothetical protein
VCSTLWRRGVSRGSVPSAAGRVPRWIRAKRYGDGGTSLELGDEFALSLRKTFEELATAQKNIKCLIGGMYGTSRIVSCL